MTNAGLAVAMVSARSASEFELALLRMLELEAQRVEVEVVS